MPDLISDVIAKQRADLPTFTREFTVSELFDLVAILAHRTVGLKHEIAKTENEELKAIYQRQLEQAEALSARVIYGARADAVRDAA